MSRVRRAAGFALVALVATACGTGDDNGGNNNSGSSGGGDSITYAEQFVPRSAWAIETDDAHTLMRAGCLETLVAVDTTGQVVPALATEWTQSAPTTWDFTLRDGVKFQDGTPVDAKTVADDLNRVLKATAPARAFNPDNVSSVEASGDMTVKVTTPAPDVLTPLRLASPNTGILAAKAFSGSQVDIVGTCTGPFTVTKEETGRSLTMERNDDYWGDKAKVANVTVQFVEDGAARASQLQANEAQIAMGLPAASRATLEGDSNVTIDSIQSPRTTVMLLNNSRPPFDDPLVRKAIQQAIDTKAIAETIYEGGASPAIGPFSADDPWAPQGAEPVTQNQDEAKKLLQQANVDPSSLSFELIAYNDRPEFGDLAAVIQDQLSQIGITVKIKAGEYAGFEPDLLAGKFDAALLSRGYTVDIADPAGFLSSDYTCDGGYNIAHYCDKDTDAMIKAAATNTDADARHQAYGQIAEKLQADAASVFLVHENLTFGIRKNVEGFEVDPLNHYVLTPKISLSGN